MSAGDRVRRVIGSDERRRPIGIFDSGLGGLTVVRALTERLPNETLVYLGDTARVPYGTKSAETVIRYALQIADFLLAHEIKYLVVACNTASAYALGPLGERLDVPLMGVVEPGAEIGARRTRSGVIGVLGTLGTIRSGAYERAVQRFRAEVSVFSQACPLLVPLAEEGWLDHPVTSQVVRHYLLELCAQAPDVDTLVLGCTHYPLLRGPIEAGAREVYRREVALVDSAEAVALAVSKDLGRRGIAAERRSGEDRFFFTDVSRFAHVAALFLGRDIPRVDHADL